MNGKWHVHFGDAQRPTCSDSFDTRDAALAQARDMRSNPSGPPFRFVSRPDSSIVPDADVAVWCSKNAVRQSN
jgi:hypothetical protein